MIVNIVSQWFLISLALSSACWTSCGLEFLWSSLNSLFFCANFCVSLTMFLLWLFFKIVLLPITRSENNLIMGWFNYVRLRVIVVFFGLFWRRSWPGTEKWWKCFSFRCWLILVFSMVAAHFGSIKRWLNYLQLFFELLLPIVGLLLKKSELLFFAANVIFRSKCNMQEKLFIH